MKEYLTMCIFKLHVDFKSTELKEEEGSIESVNARKRFARSQRLKSSEKCADHTEVNTPMRFNTKTSISSKDKYLGECLCFIVNRNFDNNLHLNIVQWHAVNVFLWKTNHNPKRTHTVCVYVCVYGTHTSAWGWDRETEGLTVQVQWGASCQQTVKRLNIRRYKPTHTHSLCFLADI